MRPANTARFTFLSPHGPEFYRDWETTAKDMVAVLRAEAGRNPYDKGLTDLVGELSTRSETFRTLWASHDVLFHQTGRKRLHHPASATSISPTRRSTCPPTRGYGCWSTPPKPALPPRTRSTCSPAGPRPRTGPTRHVLRGQQPTGISDAAG
jgi:hypothetical protein